MVSFPNAKINIGLNIIEKRSDGFHNIESVFYPVKWCDVLEIVCDSSAFDYAQAPESKPSNFESIFTSSGLQIPGSTDSNLILKAFELIKSKIPKSKATSAKSEIINIHLHKVIPMGAGLGGGSADGAFALKMLNELFEIGLSNHELRDLARQLGSDCAFFIENKPVFCFEKGDKFEDFEIDLSGKYIVLVNPNIHISTSEAYGGVIPQKPKNDLRESLKRPISAWKDLVKNDFEEKLLIKYPTIAQIKQNLYDERAVYSSMTGSGSTVYGIFEKEVDLKEKFKDFTVFGCYL